MPNYRLKRIESMILEEISLLIVRGKIKDPRVHSFLSVTRVEAAKDLTSAKVWVSSFESPETLEKAIQGLNHAAGYIQHELGQKLRTRNTPQLRFIADQSIEHSYRINKKLKDLNEE
ncbi:MAG: 30S ribosome-binding factor RbfA [Spirochaetia bacterium]